MKTITVFFIALACFIQAAGSALAQGRAAPTVDAQSQHTVIHGDDLHLLAAYYYRDPRRWRAIYEANAARLRGENLLLPGDVLTIPSDGQKPFPMAYGAWRELVGQ